MKLPYLSAMLSPTATLLFPDAIPHGLYSVIFKCRLTFPFLELLASLLLSFIKV